MCDKLWNECTIRSGGRDGRTGAMELWEWEPPTDPSRTCLFGRRPLHRGLKSRLHILSTVFFNLCLLFELASDKSRLPEEDSGWSVREAKLSMDSVCSMQ